MNPALAIGMDIFYAAVKNDWSIMKYIWILIIAPFIGSTISSTLFEYLYRPWVLMLKKL
jgi:glycerol uptake facilitator-like aquaporin